MQTTQSFFPIQSLFLRSATRQLNKQTKWIVRLNDSTFPYKRNETKPKRNGTITLYCLILYITSLIFHSCFTSAFYYYKRVLLQHFTWCLLLYECWAFYDWLWVSTAVHSLISQAADDWVPVQAFFSDGVRTFQIRVSTAVNQADQTATVTNRPPSSDSYKKLVTLM